MSNKKISDPGPFGALTALGSAHRVVRATHPFRVDAMAVLPDHLHAVWSLPPEDADYSTRLSLLKRHVSQAVRHLLPASQSASRHKRRELACGNGAFGNIRYEVMPMMPGTWIMFITIPSSMGSSPGSVIGRIQRFIVTSLRPARSVSTGLRRCRAATNRRNRANHPRAHSAPCACWTGHQASRRSVGGS